MNYPVLMKFDRISCDHEVMGGVPCIAGTRIPVSVVVSLVASGMTTTQICEEYPQIDADSVSQDLTDAAKAVRERELPLSTR